MTSLLDQTVSSTHREYLFFKTNEAEDEEINNTFIEPNYIQSFTNGRITENTRILSVLPAKYTDEYGVEQLHDFRLDGVNAEGEAIVMYDHSKAARNRLDGMRSNELTIIVNMMSEIDLLNNSEQEVEPIIIQEKMTELNNKVKSGTDMIDFGSEISNQMSMEEEKHLFERHKNKLVTLMNKNKNIKQKLDQNR